MSALPWVQPASQLRLSANLPWYPSVVAAVHAEKPSMPMRCLSLAQLTANVREFVTQFPGRTNYAVKANPDPVVIQALASAGVHHFDVASLSEIELVHGLVPGAVLAFMHPVKSPEAIDAAYHKYGVRRFVLDCANELTKIVRHTDNARDLTLLVRLAMPRGSAACSLSGKFGATQTDAVRLLKKIKPIALQIGLAFHVGSQTLSAESYGAAITRAHDVVLRSGVIPDILDVGGGFAVKGLGDAVPSLTKYFKVIAESREKYPWVRDCELWSEPGRVLVATAETLVTRIELRNRNKLYLNDGSYGNLFEVANLGWRNNIEVIKDELCRPGQITQLRPFRLFGPTCDSIDQMKGLFLLPDTVATGDWLAFASMGAYGMASQTRFNGFHETKLVLVGEKLAMG